MSGAPGEDWILYECRGHTATITFNRPAQLNALPPNAHAVLARLLHRAEQDDSIKVIVLRGNGRAFCAGMDLRNAAAIQGLTTPRPGQAAERPPQRRALIRPEQRQEDALRYCFKTTIAQVQGYCFGAGMALALACDYLVAADNALFEDPDMKFGGSGVTANLFPLVLAMGTKRARELATFGKRFTAAEGERYGLINRVVPLADLAAAVGEYTQAICALPSDGLALSKAYFLATLDLFGAAAARHVAHTAHAYTLLTRFGGDEFNFLKAQRDLGTKEALRALRDRFPARW